MDGHKHFHENQSMSHERRRDNNSRSTVSCGVRAPGSLQEAKMFCGKTDFLTCLLLFNDFGILICIALYYEEINGV